MTRTLITLVIPSLMLLGTLGLTIQLLRMGKKAQKAGVINDATNRYNHDFVDPSVSF